MATNQTTFTNRAKYLFATGGIVPGDTDLRMLLLGGGTALDHSGVPDVNTVTELLALTGFDEVTGVASYARVALTGEAATEDDGNDWANIDADDVAFGTLEPGDTPVGAVIFIEGANDNARIVVCVYDLDTDPPNEVFAPTNGGAYTVAVADFARVV